jgi:hypothetical protein
MFAVSLFLRLFPAREFAAFHLVERNIHSANTVCLLYSNGCMDREGVCVRAQCFAGGVHKTVPSQLCIQQLYVQHDHFVLLIINGL